MGMLAATSGDYLHILVEQAKMSDETFEQT